ncbi:MAG: cation transporting ATPase C-terminal domain-containing protein [Candidatus Poribacteria bacterium]|nr:cation transporting ATPase C-terminal domain-containing protein [Candidatus Poribacteria bacterium]
MSNFYAESVSFLLNQFKTDLESGLSHADVERQMEIHGKNEPNSKIDTSQIGLFFEQVLNWRLLLLVLAATVFVFTPNIPKTGFIGGILILSFFWATIVVISFGRKHKQRKAQFNITVTVMRQGTQEKCSPSDIVPGDLLLLRPGDYIPADARIVQSDGLKVNESALFGSSGSAAKTFKEITESGLPPEKQTNMVFGGTYVDAGTGNAVVVRTGNELEMHQNRGNTRALPNEMTVAENQIKFFNDILKVSGLVLGGIAVAILWWQKSPQSDPNWIEFVQFGLIFAIAATPHDLVLLLHSILDQRVSAVLKKGIALRERHFLEKLNRLTAFCSDEKGIASTKSLTISSIFVDQKMVNRSEWENWLNSLKSQSSEEKSKRINNIPPRFQIPQGAPGLVLTAGLGTSGEQYYDRTGIDHAHQLVIQDTMEQLGYKLADLKANMHLVSEYPWTPNFGYELHVFESGENEYLNIIFGDARNVLEACNSILVNGEVSEFHYEQYEMCNEILNYMQNPRDTVYGVASLNSEVPLTPPEVQEISTFLGFISFSVTDNDETKEVIKSFMDTGIKVILMSESDEQATTDLARELGLVHTRNAVGTREELRHLSTQEFDKEILNWNAYSQPTQEQRRNIVLSLKRHNHSVGFLGQNANDQRAMITADLAFADARYASHFAQDHADCLIIEKGFKAVKDCLLYAREAYHNLSGTLRWCLSCTLAQFFTVIFGLILHTGFTFELPLTLTQVVWVQFLTTLLPAIGLGYEKISVNEKQYHPGRASMMFPKTAVLDIVCRSLVISLMTITHFLVVTSSGTESNIEAAQTAACTTLIFAQVAVYFQCTRYPWESLFKRMFTNVRLFIIFIIVIGIHVSAMYIRPMQDVLKIVPLQQEWIITSLCSLILLLLPLNLAINPRKDRT